MNYVTIDTVLPIGISSNLNNYIIIDKSPLLGANIYRIKAISSNRAFEYSEVLPLTFPKKPDLFLFPNPTDGIVQIEVKNVQAENIKLEFFLPNGQLILEFGWQAISGKKFTETVLLNQLPTGVYFYRILNGNEVGVGKLMIR